MCIDNDNNPIIKQLEAERDALKAELARLADLHPHCAAFDDQPGPCECRSLKAELAQEKFLNGETLRNVLEEKTGLYNNLVASKAQVERLTAALHHMNGCRMCGENMLGECGTDLAALLPVKP